MAKYNLDNYLAKDGLGFPLNFRRGNPNPLDNSSVWKSLELAQNYAQNDPTAYVGQIISVVDYTSSDNSTVTVYSIKDEAGTLQPVGSSSIGDEGTITVASDGTISLFGIEGLELTRTDENGEVTSITYQPLYVNGKLIWVEPSTTTVEGLSLEIESLKNRTTILESTIGTVEDGKTIIQLIQEATYDDSELADKLKAIEDDYLKKSDKTELANLINSKANQTDLNAISNTVVKHTDDIAALKGRIQTNEGKIATLNGNSTVVGSVDYKIAEAFNEFITSETADEVVNTFKELIDYTKTHGNEATAMATAIISLEGEMDVVQKAISEYDTSISNNSTAISELEILVGEKSVKDQINEAIIKANLDQYATDTELAVLDYRTSVIEKDYLKDEDKTEIVNLISTNTTKLTNIESVLANKANNSDLNSAIDRIVALEEIGFEKSPIESVDEEQFNIDENRNLTLLDIAIEKVTGLSDALAEKVTAVEGSRLITETEANKLGKIEVTDDGFVITSAENVSDLSNWITDNIGEIKGLSENNLTDELLEKLNNAQANVIESISINNVPLAISDKSVNIPIATAESFGVVKSSIDQNKVSVDENGIMEVNSLNVNRLVQDEGDSLILNGGSAT